MPRLANVSEALKMSMLDDELVFILDGQIAVNIVSDNEGFRMRR